MAERKLLERVSVIDALTKAFTEEIVNGLLEPGFQCRDTTMAEKYGVSRNSVREAFSILVEQGLLKKKANRGFFVPIFTARDIRELYGARLIIELEAIETLASRREVTCAMYTAVDLLKERTTKDMRSRVLDADMQFHLEIVASLHNERISQIHRKLYMEILMINLQPHQFFPIDYTISEHERVIATILTGDSQAARQVLKDHLTISIERQIAEMESRKSD
jgi:DNA-binding GntR family transcriptional regulator